MSRYAGKHDDRGYDACPERGQQQAWAAQQTPQAVPHLLDRGGLILRVKCKKGQPTKHRSTRTRIHSSNWSSRRRSLAAGCDLLVCEGPHQHANSGSGKGFLTCGFDPCAPTRIWKHLDDLAERDAFVVRMLEKEEQSTKKVRKKSIVYLIAYRLF